MKRLFIFYFLSLPFKSDCFAQSGEWTWMNGDNFIKSDGFFGTQGIPSSLNSPPSVYEPCEWKDNQGNFWLFGGYHQNLVNATLQGEFSDLWKYNTLTNEWTWVKGPGVSMDFGHYGIKGIPSVLNNPACRGWGTPTWVDNAGNFWMYGGSIGYSDLWRYTISTNEWTWMHGDTTAVPQLADIPPVYGTLQIASILNTPGTRQETAASWTDNAGNLWLFGGLGFDSINFFGQKNDMWKFDLSINQWIWMSGLNYSDDTGYYGIKGVASPLNRPSARSAYAKWKDASGNFYLFGGISFGLNAGCYYSSYNDVWKYDVSTNYWTWIGGDSTVNSPGSYSPECVTNSTNIPRNGFENRATCFDSCGNAFMFGTIGGACSLTAPTKNELWNYNSISNLWTLLKQDGTTSFGVKGVSSGSNKPPKVAGSVSWKLENEIWIFGGSENGSSDSYNSMWRYKIDTICTPCGALSASPVANLIASDTSFCDKNSINFTDLSTNNPTSWNWYFPGAIPDTSSLQNPTGIYYANFGSYQVALNCCNNAGCDSLFLPGFITVLPAPIPPVISQNADTLFSSPSFAYLWYDSSNPTVSLSSLQFYITNQPGSYFVIVCDSFGCCSSSALFTITNVNAISGFDHNFSISPNPNHGVFAIRWNVSAFDKMKISVFDCVGKNIFEDEIQDRKFEKVIDLSWCDEGVYFVKISIGEILNFKKVVVFK